MKRKIMGLLLLMLLCCVVLSGCGNSGSSDAPVEPPSSGGSQTSQTPSSEPDDDSIPEPDIEIDTGDGSTWRPYDFSRMPDELIYSDDPNPDGTYYILRDQPDVEPGTAFKVMDDDRFRFVFSVPIIPDSLLSYIEENNLSYAMFYGKNKDTLAETVILYVYDTGVIFGYGGKQCISVHSYEGYAISMHSISRGGYNIAVSEMTSNCAMLQARTKLSTLPSYIDTQFTDPYPATETRDPIVPFTETSITPPEDYIQMGIENAVLYE